MSRIALLGLDGLRLPIALECSPVLARLAALGVCTPMQMEVPTISGPGWASLLTGTRHAQHGIVDNTFVGSRLWHHPDVLSLAFYRDQRTTTFAAAAWPPLVDPTGPGPVIFPRVEQQRAGQHRVVVRDGETYGYRRTDAEIAVLAAAALTEAGPDLSFVYFCGADEAGHLFGSVGPEYRSAIADIDRHLTTLISILERRVTAGEDWLIVVTTDHGHRDEGGHGGDSPAERASFTIAWQVGSDGTTDWPARLAPHELAGALLDRLSR